MGPLQGFVHPGLLGLAALAVVPLLIHLLRRRKPRTLEWGAMRLVRLAHERTRRRTNFENLLLLLLRMAAVAAGALLIARPLLRDDALPGVLDAPRRDVVLLLDASASMQQLAGGESAFSRALREAERELGTLRDERGDRAVLIVAGEQAQLLAERSLGEVRAALAGDLAAEDGTADYAGACALVGRWLERRSELDARHAPELHLYTDLQHSGLSTREFGAALDALAPYGVALQVHSVAGTERPDDLAVEAPRVLVPHPRPGVPFPVEVDVHNAGARPATARIALFVGGEKVGSEALAVDGGARTRARFEARVAASGEVLVEARLEGDAYPLDDASGSVIEVAAPLDVLLVSGELDADLERDPSAYLQAALGSTGGAETPLSDAALFDARVVGSAELDSPDVDLARPDVVWLVDLPSLSANAAARLRARLDAGAPLVISLGPRSEPSAWAAWSCAEDGAFGPQALLPARLDGRRELADRAPGYFRAATIDAEHPALSFFADERWRPLFCELPYRGFVASTPARDARVLARFDDPSASPLLVELPLARTSVYLWTSSFDRAWSRLPDSPRTLIPLLQEWLLGAADPTRAPRRAVVGATLFAELRGFPREPSWRAPDDRTVPLAGPVQEVAANLWRVECGERARRVGAWRLVCADAPPRHWWIELPQVERDLARIDARDLPLVHPLLRAAVETAAPDADATDGAPARHAEWWRLCVWLVLALLVAESLWAARIGSRRS
ncbi:MAG: hypothetical protein EPO68_17895 [Planctomycetota bacterium]|nr:MAG: hypothetical protein EPO68_17895 [Planctomycetota bacterium]